MISKKVECPLLISHEVNYFFWGVMCAVASKNGQTNVTRNGMVSRIYLYRRLLGDPAYSRGEYGGTIAGRVAWAEAGWDYVENGTFNSPSNERIKHAVPTNRDYNGLFQVFANREIVVTK
ncbi:MAG: hypothetical protein ABL888_03850 [Pirellulaceae bacterium]